jgi:hypothetical protein
MHDGLNFPVILTLPENSGIRKIFAMKKESVANETIRTYGTGTYSSCRHQTLDL